MQIPRRKKKNPIPQHNVCRSTIAEIYFLTNISNRLSDEQRLDAIRDICSQYLQSRNLDI